jgi:nicotinate-nucleotide adenylyltransferase
MERRKIGLLGGTFDPPTILHIDLAELAIERFGLERVILIPAADPWQKSPASSAADRLAMCKLAVMGHKRLNVSDMELQRSGPTYTVDTLRYLVTKCPEAEFMFLIGEDIDTSTWHDESECRRLAQFVRIARTDIKERFGIGIDLGVPSGSSTEAREAIAAGKESHLLQPRVKAYITKNGLYI